MAVLLTEFVVGRVLATLQDGTYGINAQLVKIDAERGDGAILAFVDGWFDTRRDEFGAERVEVCVFEDDVSFPHQTYMMSGWSPANPQPIQSATTVTVRLTHANRDGSSGTIMVRRSRRYLCAIVRVFRDCLRLLDMGDTVKSVLLNSATMNQVDDLIEDGRRRVVDRVELRMTVMCDEVSASEGVPSGGLPPSFISPTI